ncbi:MAG: hypothetical protein M3R21_02380 [Candidatus Dormibacteraeota bacterium]|nr:hypothetical protein [Candidatus Dormibacteraeota bacterium]
MRDRSATRALVLGLIGLPFGVIAPFAVWSGIRSVRRIRAARGDLTGLTSASLGLASGLLGVAALVLGTVYWFLAS